MAKPERGMNEPSDKVESAPRNSALRTRHSALQMAKAVFLKDWRSEWRVRAALNAIALFAIAAPIAMSFTVARQALEPETQAGLLWAVLLFASLVGLSRAFVKEEESGTSQLLRLSCSAESVLWGKAAFNLALLLITQLAAVPIFMIMLNAEPHSPGALLLVLLLGDIGLAGVSTLLGAIAAQTRSRGALFAAIAVPVLLPLLVAASSATAIAFGRPGDIAPMLQTLAAYDAAMLTAAWLLFDYVWAP
jgi:heme exporter protein B